MKTKKELKEEIEELKRNKNPHLKEINEEIEKELKIQLKTLQERNVEVKQIINDWYNDEKTCSGKPHCCIEECDLCVECFNELLQKLGLGEK